MNMLSILLDAPAQGGGSGWSTIIFLVVIIAVFYFFMIRPQQKQQKQLRNFRESLKEGDKIITIGGIHGKIVSKKEKTFLVQIADSGRLEVDHAAIATNSEGTTTVEAEK